MEHTRWSKWQSYLHSKCIKNEDGSLTIPAGLVVHWERQISTPYSQLTEPEKEADRREVRPYIEYATQTATRVREETIEEVKQKIESLRTHYVPADNKWFGDENYGVGEYRLVPAKDPSKAMYCLTCGRFLPEEGCICGMVTVDKVLSTLNK